MGMFGKGVGKAILNQVAINLLGRDFEGEKEQAAKRERLAQLADSLINGDLRSNNTAPIIMRAGQLPGAAPIDQVSIGGPAPRQASEIPAYQAPTRTGAAPITDPRWAALMLQGGPKMAGVLQWAQANQPDVRYDRGYGFNSKTGEPMGAFHTELDKGMKPGADGRVANAPGYVDAAAEAAGAVTGAQEGAKAKLDVISIEMPDGSKQQIPRDVAVQAILQSLTPGGAGGGSGSGFGRSQTPAEASAAKIKGDAIATAQTTLPADLNGVDLAIETATALSKHPALNSRVGGWSMLPAIPGTPGASFEAYKKQVLGQGWLDARQALKGGGPITDSEGKKAEQAKMRMDAAQTPEDFKAGLADYIGALQRGRKILEQKAGAPATPSQADVAAELRRRGLLR